MPIPSFASILRMLLTAAAVAPASVPALAQMAVIDPSNLIQNALTATRTLQQINNQIAQITNQVRSLENEARNLTNLGQRIAPEIIQQLRDLDALINTAGGVALEVQQTRDALQTLFSGRYAGTDFATRARTAVQQIDASRAALQNTLVMQAAVTEQLRGDQMTLARLAEASAGATGALAATQATNEFLAFQAQQSMRLQALLVAQTRAEAVERAREMEVQAQGRAQSAYFFSGARSAHPGQRPWN